MISRRHRAGERSGRKKKSIIDIKGAIIRIISETKDVKWRCKIGENKKEKERIRKRKKKKKKKGSRKYEEKKSEKKEKKEKRLERSEIVASE